MFSINAIGAYFMYMGGYFHTRLCEFLASDMLVRSVLAFCFGFMLLMSLIQYFARQTGTSLVSSGYVSFGQVVKVVVCYLIGIAVLIPDTAVTIKDFTREDFSESRYIAEKMNGIDPEIRLSLPTALMVKSSEEIGWLAMKLVDLVMGGIHSSSEAPNLYYKAMLLGAASQVEDKKLRGKMELYTVDCIQPLLSLIKGDLGAQKFGQIINFSDKFSDELEKIKTADGLSCNSLRKIIYGDLYNEMVCNGSWIDKLFDRMKFYDGPPEMGRIQNYKMASALVNFYKEKYEGSYGVMDGAKIPGLYGSFFQHLGKFFSIEGQLRNKDGWSGFAGSGAAIERAKEFNEQLRMGPMIQGLCKGGLIVFSALFPFFWVFMRWRITLWVWMVYITVCLWPAIWAALYNLVGSLFSAPELLEKLGAENDAFSLLAATQINDQVYYASQVIYWAAAVACPGITSMVGFFGGQWLMSSREDHAPVAVQQAMQTTSTAVLIGKGL
ncbi:MAG: hypothetical protein K2Q26_12555 [Bdellovibrionales bacterium]|nr:hypothetical protein [Bdellovibrionales bacterium]